MSDLLKAKAQLWVDVNISCPNCHERFDLMDLDHVNDEGQLWHIIGNWANGVKEAKEINMEVQCPKCLEDFIFDEMEY